MLQIGSIDAGPCIDVPNTSARKTGVTPIARQVSLTLFTGRNVGKPGKPFICCAEPSWSSITKRWDVGSVEHKHID